MLSRDDSELRRCELDDRSRRRREWRQRFQHDARFVARAEHPEHEDKSQCAHERAVTANQSPNNAASLPPTVRSMKSEPFVRSTWK